MCPAVGDTLEPETILAMLAAHYHITLLFCFFSFNLSCFVIITRIIKSQYNYIFASEMSFFSLVNALQWNLLCVFNVQFRLLIMSQQPIVVQLIYIQSILPSLSLHVHCFILSDYLKPQHGQYIKNTYNTSLFMFFPKLLTYAYIKYYLAQMFIISSVSDETSSMYFVT